MTKQASKLFFAACREVGLDDDTRHLVQARVTGKESTKHMDRSDFAKLMEELKANHGWVAIGSTIGTLLGSFFPAKQRAPTVVAQIGYQTSAEQAIGTGNQVATPQNIMGRQDWNYWRTDQALPPYIPGWAWSTSTLAPGTEDVVRNYQGRALGMMSNLGYAYGADFGGQNIGTVFKDGKVSLFARRTDTAVDQWTNKDGASLATGAAAYSFDPSKQEEINDAVARFSVTLLARAASVANDNVAKAAKHIDLSLSGKEINGLLEFAQNFNDAIQMLNGGITDIGESVGIKTRQQVIQTTSAITAFMEKTRALGLDTAAAATATKNAVEVLIGLRAAAEPLSATAQAVQSLNATMGNIQPLLDMVGITTSVDSLRQAANDNLRTGFNAGLDDLILAYTDNAQLLRRAEEKRYQDQIADAKLVNGALEKVEQLHQIKLQQINEQANQAQIQAAQQTLASIKGTLNELTYGSLTTISAEDRLTLARGEFTSTRAKALAGDADATAQVSEVVKRFLESSREVNASGSAYQTDYTSATDLLKHFAGVPGYADGGISSGPQLAWVSEGRWQHEAHVPLPNGRSIPVELRGAPQNGDNGAVVAAIDRAADRAAAGTDALRREVAALRRENEELRGKIDRVVSGMAAAGGRR